MNIKIEEKLENRYFEACTHPEDFDEPVEIRYVEDCDDCEPAIRELCNNGEYIKIINHISEEQLYNQALEKWGIEAQEGMLLEEIGEVLIAWNKRNRNLNGCTFEQYTEELVDLQIMLGQMEVVLGDQFREIKEEKLKRLYERLQEGEQ